MSKMEVSRALNKKIASESQADSSGFWKMNIGKCDENGIEHDRIAVIFKDSSVSESNELCKTVAWVFGVEGMPYGLTPGMKLSEAIMKIPQEDLFEFFSKDSNIQSAGKINTKKGMMFLSENKELVGWRYHYDSHCN